MAQNTKSTLETLRCPDREKIQKRSPVADDKFDHHSCPKPFKIKFATSRLKQLQVPEETYNSDQRNYTKAELVQQVDKWHEKEPRYLVNSIAVHLRPAPYHGVFLYKRAGATAGQIISIGLYELEKLITLFCDIILPDIEHSEDEDVRIPKRDFEPLRDERVDFCPMQISPPLVRLRDTVYGGETKHPDSTTLLGKVTHQKNSKDFYENGLYNTGSLQVHVSKINERWFIGLYKTEGDEKHQSVWFSVYEAQWVIDRLAKVYKETLQKLIM